MAEVYWMDGFQRPCRGIADASAILMGWLDQRGYRHRWIEQVQLLSETIGSDATWQEQDVELAFHLPLAAMDEHFFLQQMLRRMRMDESESQLLLTLRGETLSGALFMNHRQVGRSNLPPRLIIGEQMAVILSHALADHLQALPALMDRGLCLCSHQPALLEQLPQFDAQTIQCKAYPGLSLAGILLALAEEEALSANLGLLLSQQADQPALVTSVQRI